MGSTWQVGGSFRTRVIFFVLWGLALFFVPVYYQHYVFFLRYTGRLLVYFGSTTTSLTSTSTVVYLFSPLFALHMHMYHFDFFA